jgi:maltoporin
MRRLSSLFLFTVAICASREARAQTTPRSPEPEPEPVTVPGPAPARAPEVQQAPSNATAASLPTPSATVASSPTDGFQFGSYGRVRIASDGRGGTGRQTNVVSHGSRIDEESYAELELRREDTFKDDIKSKVVATLALFPPFFHFSGNAAQAIAIRNLFAQGTYGRWTLWAGARMYRGDDIYLLDWWPLHNQNTIGGGAAVKIGDATDLAAHVGMQRLDNPYQFQTIPSPNRFGVGTTDVTKLDRPRTVETLKLTHYVRHLSATNDKLGFKVIVYGEAHQLAAGVQRDTLTNVDRPLPSDSGWLLGTQLGFWTGERDTHVNLFFRHARGVAAYDPLSTPSTFANDRTTSGSSETLVALGANYEVGSLGVMAGAYLRFFRDGDPSPTSTQKFDEGTVVVRPQVFLGEHFGIAVEGSVQARRLAVVDPATDSALTATVFKGGLIPYFSPSGRGAFKRPQLRLLYAVSGRDSGARALYPTDDVFAQRTVEHFIGIGAEWWFNSSSYP